MYSWLSTEVLTGRVITELLDLECRQVSKKLGGGSTASASLPLTEKLPENWQRATLEGASTLVLVDTESGIPVWGGMILTVTPDDTDALPINLATYEDAYLKRRYVGDQSYTQVGAVDIMVDLANRYLRAGSNGGIPLRVQVIGSSRGVVVDREYADTDDQTVLDRFTELAGLENGPEWTIAWETLDGGITYTPVLRISGTRIGNAVVPSSGISPAATFEIPGSVTSVSQPRSYSDGDGANDVLAISTGSAERTGHIVTADPNRPTFEYRFTPDVDDDNPDTLTAHGRAQAVALFGGTRTLALQAAVTAAPRLGIDWVEGDDIGYIVGGIDADGVDTLPAFPGGISGVVRALGWVLDLEDVPQVTPVLEGGDS